MKKLEYFQHRMMQTVGTIGVLLASLFYFSTVYLVLKEHWSFFDEVTGDVLFLCFLTSGYLLVLAFFSIGLRFQMRWAHFMVLLLTMGYVLLTSKYIHQMQGEDTRWQNLSNNLFTPPVTNATKPN
ncbi:MAG: hypothetical protein RML72_05250 [Bacteroidia bacterium]|nr:hypothetical protein [Bacteroidia bacterium]MDW8158270.1 hypothetical protein [Bacteroidia bacterium]